jgi:hypothetical protein
MAAIPRGTVIGKVDGPPLTEAEHFWKCEFCGGWFDIRTTRDRYRTRRAIKCSNGRIG